MLPPDVKLIPDTPDGVRKVLGNHGRAGRTLCRPGT